LIYTFVIHIFFLSTPLVRAVFDLQWGIIENDTYTTSWNKTIIFPIKFQVPYAVAISAYDVDKSGDHHGEFGCHVYNLTQSSLTCDYYASRDATDKVMYIVIGKG